MELQDCGDPLMRPASERMLLPKRAFVDVPAPAGADLPRHVRVNAALHLALGAGIGGGRILERREEGALRYRLPRRPDGVREAMIVNVAGGLAGGDQIRIGAQAEAGSRLVVSSAAAERIYRSAGDITSVTLNLTVANEACLAWLPNETILHDGARLTRRAELTLAPAGRLLVAEIVVLGRKAAGEHWRAGAFQDSWRLRRGEKLLFAEELRLGEAFPDAFERDGGLAGCNALATLLFCAPDAEDHLSALRTILSQQPEIRFGASARDGLVFARLVGEDDLALRRATARAAQALAGRNLPLPRLMLGDPVT
jgi:urease accessory protein